jgi:hypothetical protein
MLRLRPTIISLTMAEIRELDVSRSKKQQSAKSDRPQIHGITRMVEMPQVSSAAFARLSRLAVNKEGSDMDTFHPTSESNSEEEGVSPPAVRGQGSSPVPDILGRVRSSSLRDFEQLRATSPLSDLPTPLLLDGYSELGTGALDTSQESGRNSAPWRNSLKSCQGAPSMPAKSAVAGPSTSIADHQGWAGTTPRPSSSFGRYNLRSTRRRVREIQRSRPGMRFANCATAKVPGQERHRGFVFSLSG